MDKKSAIKNPAEIPNVKFKRDQTLGFELVSLKELKNKLTAAKGHNPYKPHRLKFYLTFFITGGKGKHFIDFQYYDYCRGMVIYISKEKVHAFDPSFDCEGESILFTETFFTKNLSDTERSIFNSLFNYHIHSPLNVLSSDQFANMERTFMSLREEFAHQADSFKPHILRNLLKQFLLQMERLRNGPEGRLDFRHYNEFIALQKLLDNHMHQERSVKFYAQKLGISTKKMNLITQSIANLASKDYITSRLVLEAKRLLVSSFDSIDEIGYRMGFEEPTNFVKFFKKESGQTPAAFRKSHS